MITNGHDREALAARANAVRARLVETAEALDRRRREALDVRLQLRRHAGALSVAAGALAVTLIGGGVLLTLRLGARRRGERRLRVLRNLVGLVARDTRSAPPPWLVATGRSLAVSLVSAAVAGVLRSAVTKPLVVIAARVIRRALPGLRAYEDR